MQLNRQNSSFVSNSPSVSYNDREARVVVLLLVFSYLLRYFDVEGCKYRLELSQLTLSLLSVFRYKTLITL